MGDIVVSNKPAVPVQVYTLKEMNAQVRRFAPGHLPDVIRLGGDRPGPNEIRIAHVGQAETRVVSLVAHQDVVAKIADQIGGIALARNPFGLDILRNEFLDQYPTEWKIPPHDWVEYEDSDAEWAYPIRYGWWEKNYKRLLVIALHAAGVDFSQKRLTPPPIEPPKLAKWEPWELIVY